MSGRFAALLSCPAQNTQARRMLTTLVSGAMGTLIACGFTTILAPAPPTSTPPSLQTPGNGSTLSSDAIPPSYTATTTPSVTATPPQPTAQSTEHPSHNVQVEKTEPTPTPGSRHPSQTTEPTAATDLPPVATPHPPATPMPSPPLPPSEGSGISVYAGQLTLPTYPYQDFLSEEQDALYGIAVQHLNRAAYEAAAPRPLPQVYRTLVIENAYLRLTFLPELGGRLYSVVVKSTGQEAFFHNPVVKPSRYGPLFPIEDNWWLGVGGMEWAFPVQEHGYAWGLPWTSEVTSTPQSVTVTLRDSTEPGRVRAEVQVTLPANRGTFSIQPRLVNDTERSLPIQFWLNAALSPGSPSVAPDTRIIVPVSQVVVHSRGETGWDLPGPRSPMPWPLAGGHDLSRYDQWANYLGFFIPYMQAGFMAVYNPDADLGITRIVLPGQVPGHKFFAFGPNFSDRSYTDDDSQYVEMWGGANSGFWPEDDIQLAPGGAIEWRETWWPLAGLGGITFANDEIAFNLLNSSGLRILSARQREVTLVLLANGVELSRAPLTLNPTRPSEWPIPTVSSPSIQIQFFASDGNLIADYQTSLHRADTLS